MSLTLQWEDIALRLLLTVIAGALIGINRSEGGHPAGLRTTLLVCLAASVAMIQASVLMGLTGKTPGSFAVLDLMRLPLGILTGMGFIGGGAILKKGDMVHGVTTAATLWLVTVIGLCLGGGQLALGMAATALALLILYVPKGLEARMSLDRHASLDMVVEEGGPSNDDLHAALRESGLKINSWRVETRRRAGHLQRTIHCELKWRVRSKAPCPPAVINDLAQQSGVKAMRWKT